MSKFKIGDRVCHYRWSDYVGTVVESDESEDFDAYVVKLMKDRMEDYPGEEYV